MNRIVLMALMFTSILEAQWTIHRLPTNNRYTGIYFADSLNGWIFGWDGIFHTTNGGDSWTLQRSGFVEHMTGFNSQKCWATGWRDTLLHTTNGGNDWVQVWMGGALDSIGRLGRISFVDSLHGWVVANRIGVAGNWILRTTDGGINWSAFPVNLTSFDFLCTFVDTLTGWVSGRESGAVARTTDGGLTWQEISYVYRSATDIQFLTREIGWICSDSPIIATEVLKSTNRGNSWFSQQRFECSDLSTYVNFADTLHGWVVQYNCFTGLEIVHTSDGGLTWTSQFTYLPSFYWSPTRIYFVDTSHGWVIGYGDSGLVFRTKTGGLTSIGSESEQIPDDFRLSQNYPNPFNPSTTIAFSIPLTSYVVLRVYNLLGQEVKTLIDREVAPGSYSVDWNGVDPLGQHVSSGVYIYQLLAYGSGTEQFVSSKKMLIIR
jgi:photosystem II stability/assembly factor-like uncharacterized protein